MAVCDPIKHPGLIDNAKCFALVLAGTASRCGVRP